MPTDIINALGFQYDNAIDVKGRLSISDLFPKSKKRCGIYLLNFSDNTFYIGQAIDAVKRFSQHRKNYDNILRYWFIEIKKENLNVEEERLIKSAEASGLLITNKTFVSNVIGETDLDLVITQVEQSEWLENNRSISNDGYDLYPSIDLKYKIKYQHNYNKFKQNEIYPQLKNILNKYITQCIPAFKKTELSFWSLSCLPATNIGSFPRYFCVNINSMEVFVVGYDKKQASHFCFINITKRFLHNVDDIELLYENLETKYDGLEIAEINYRAAGNDQICFHFQNLNEFENLITNEPEIIDSIKEMNLRLMRKGGTIYSPFHCFELVKDILE